MTSDNYFIMGQAPLLELGLLFLLIGCGVFLVQSKVQGEWPFEKPAIVESETTATVAETDAGVSAVGESTDDGL